MIKKSDLNSLSDKTRNIINLALGFLIFMKKEDAERYKDTLNTLRAEFLANLSCKNLEYENIAKKALRVVKTEYILKIEKLEQQTQSTSVANTKILINNISDSFIDSAKNVLHIDDKSFTVSNIGSKIASYNVKSQYSDYIKYTADAVLKLQEIFNKHEEDLKPHIVELKSNFDTFCVKTQNILFHKYLSILCILDKIEYVSQLIDAFTVLSIIISEEKLFTQDAAISFLNDNSFESALNILRRCDYID